MSKLKPEWVGPDNCTHLLLPVDGSPRSLAAVRHAVALAKSLRHPTRVLLLNVQPPVRGNVGRFIAEGDLRRLHEDEGRRALARSARLLAEAGLAHETQVVVGDVRTAILDAAERHDCQAIVMANRGRGGLSGTLLGSVSLHLLQHSARPVILVHA